MARALVVPGIERFILVYALAWSGGAIAYTPFLTLLLPERIAALVGPTRAVDWLSAVAFSGAIAASVAHIAFGYASDLTRNRRGWIAAGLALSSFLLALFPSVSGFWTTIAFIGLWQCALNMMLAPLAALAGDVVPDARKGLLGGSLSFAPAVGAASGAILTWPGIAAVGTRPALVAALVVACVAPVLFVRLPRAVDPRTIDGEQPEPDGENGRGRRVVVRMWLARLSLQIAEAALFAFLYLWFRAIAPSLGASGTAVVFGAVLFISIPVTIAIGRWADGHGRPLRPLRVCAAVSAIGLVAMALSRSTVEAIGFYGLFGVASSVFLALHTAQTLRILPRPDRRGRDLGFFNLTNTTPSLVMPALALALVPAFGYSGLFLTLAGLAALAAVLVPRISD